MADDLLNRHKHGLNLALNVKHVSRETQKRLCIYHDLLVQWQKQINLISPTTVNDIWARHIADSLQIAEVLEGVEHLIDLGSGAGLPGLIAGFLMVEEKKGRLDMVESVGKKCAFLRTAARETGLKDAGLDIQIHNKRIEKSLNELPRPHAISARALASLDRLFEMTEFHLTQGTTGLFPKGKDFEREIKEAQQNWVFDVSVFPSQMEQGAALLKIENLRRKSAL